MCLAQSMTILTFKTNEPHSADMERDSRVLCSSSDYRQSLFASVIDESKRQQTSSVLLTSGGGSTSGDQLIFNELLLASLSPLLYSILSEHHSRLSGVNECSIILPDVSHHTLEQLVTFVHSGGLMTLDSVVAFEQLVELIQLLEFNHFDDIVLLDVKRESANHQPPQPKQSSARQRYRERNPSEDNQAAGIGGRCAVDCDPLSTEDRVTALPPQNADDCLEQSCSPTDSQHSPPTPSDHVVLRSPHLSPGPQDDDAFNDDQHDQHDPLGIQQQHDDDGNECRRLFTTGRVASVKIKTLKSDIIDRAKIANYGTSEFGNQMKSLRTGLKEQVIDTGVANHDASDSRNQKQKLATGFTEQEECKMELTSEDVSEFKRQNTFKCDYCDENFYKKYHLQRHIMTAARCKARSDDKDIDYNERPFKCDNCDRRFERKYHLERHVMTTGCDGTNRIPHACHLCEKSFNRKVHLTQHLRSHSGTTSMIMLSCRTCRKVFQGRPQFKIHLRTHTGERPFVCDFCQKGFTCSQALRKHRRTHTGERPYECAKCWACFAVKETLNRHMKSHMAEKPHRCEYCSKSFIQIWQLKEHVFKHTGENALDCAICGKIFTRQSRLNMHMKHVHMGERPFSCQKCKKQLVRKEDVQRHAIMHSGIKAHKCTHCERSFGLKASLNTHVQIRHSNSEKQFKCEDCPYSAPVKVYLKRHRQKVHPTIVKVEATDDKHSITLPYHCVKN